MNGCEFKNQILRIFEKAREKCPGITNDMLDSNGAIYYMNGNDSTHFDWTCNDRLCEFYVFHKNEVGFIKMFVYKDGGIEVYIYEDAGMRPTEKFTENLNGNAYEFAKLMNHIADDKAMWDKPIDELNWDMDTSECYELNYYDDEDEW